MRAVGGEHATCPTLVLDRVDVRAALTGDHQRLARRPRAGVDDVLVITSRLDQHRVTGTGRRVGPQRSGDRPPRLRRRTRIGVDTGGRHHVGDADRRRTTARQGQQDGHLGGDERRQGEAFTAGPEGASTGQSVAKCVHRVTALGVVAGQDCASTLSCSSGRPDRDASACPRARHQTETSGPLRDDAAL